MHQWRAAASRSHPACICLGISNSVRKWSSRAGSRCCCPVETPVSHRTSARLSISPALAPSYWIVEVQLPGDSTLSASRLSFRFGTCAAPSGRGIDGTAQGADQPASALSWLAHTLDAELYTRAQPRVFIPFEHLLRKLAQRGRPRLPGARPRVATAPRRGCRGRRGVHRTGPGAPGRVPDGRPSGCHRRPPACLRKDGSRRYRPSDQ